MKTDSLNANASVQSEQNSSLADASVRYPLSAIRRKGVYGAVYAAIVDATGREVCSLGASTAAELVHRANAYDALVAFAERISCFATFDGHRFDIEANTLLASLTSPLEEK